MHADAVSLTYTCLGAAMYNQSMFDPGKPAALFSPLPQCVRLRAEPIRANYGPPISQRGGVTGAWIAMFTCFLGVWVCVKCSMREIPVHSVAFLITHNDSICAYESRISSQSVAHFWQTQCH